MSGQMVAQGDVRRSLAYLRPHRRSLLLAVALIVPVTVLEILKPWPIKLVLDNVIPGRAWPPLASLDPEGLLAVAVVGLVAVHAVLGLLTVAYNTVTIGIGQSMVNDLRGQLFDHLQRLSLGYHARAPVGDLIHRLTLDSFSIQTLAMNGLFPVIGAALLLLGMFAVMLSMSWQLTLVALAICPLLFGGLAAIDRRVAALARAARDRESDVFARAQRGLSAIRVVQAFGMEASERQGFVASSTASLAASRRLYLVQTWYATTVNVILAVGTALVLWLGARNVWGARVTAGDLVVFVSYLAALYGPLNAILQTYGLVVGARAGLRRIFEVLDGERPLADGTHAPSTVRGEVIFEGVSFSYDGMRRVLHEVSLRVRPGEVVALVGESGAGKSTLLGLLPRFADADAGRLLVDGFEVRAWRLDALRRAIAMVLQPPLVFPISIADNIAYGEPAASRAEIERVGRLAGVDAFVSRLPFGYDTVVGEQGATLSEGERQRITIARALLRDPPILILDEPTSSVDPATEAAILDGIRSVSRGRTTFIIAHRLATVRRADRIVVLREGRIAEEGTYDELVRLGGVFSGLHDLHRGGPAERGSPAFEG